MELMVDYVNTLAQAYQLTGDEEFAMKGVDILNHWFISPETSMNPNLTFGQMIPGENQGSYWGIIETVDFIEMTDSIQMLMYSPHFEMHQQRAVKEWFEKYLTWLLNSDFGMKEGRAKNNHGVWYDAQVATYAHFVGKEDIAKTILSEVPEKRIASQIEPDGKMPWELSRTRAKDYTVYTLRAYITLARLGDELGINLYDYSTSDGRSIKKAIDWFIPYATADGAFDYQQITPFNPTQFGRSLHLANLHYMDSSYDVRVAEILHKAE